MRLKISILIIILLSIFANAQEAKRYKGEIFLDSLKTLNATFSIDYSHSKSKEFYFYINKNAKIESLKINNKSIDYKVENLTNFLPDLKKIILKNTFSKEINLMIQYSYPLDKIEHLTFLYNPNWVELSLYTGWFPVNLDDKNYSYKLTFDTPKNYQIISPGKIKKKGDKTIILNKENYFDIPVVISDDFQTFNSKNEKIKFYGTQLSNEQIKDIQHTSDNIYNFYTAIFGKSDSNELIVAVNPFAHQMSYARKGFISLSLKSGFTNRDKQTLSHEIAHLWWINAPFGNYEEWLNESFAEFSALLWMKEKLSEEEFAKLLNKYETAYKKPTKISQTSPDEDNWYSIAYLKGAYILYRLEKKIGKEKMAIFLQQVYSSKISNTRDLILLLEKNTNKDIAKEFAQEIY